MESLSNDAWSWAHEEDETLADVSVKIDTSTVVGVLVAHNAEDWLDQTLDSLAELESKPGRLVAVNTGHDDASLEILKTYLEQGVITDLVSAPSNYGFGQAVALGLSAVGIDSKPRILPAEPQVAEDKPAGNDSEEAEQLGETSSVDEAKTSQEAEVDSAEAGNQDEAQDQIVWIRRAVESSESQNSYKWIWLLHDDVVAFPQTLQQLVSAGESGTDVVVPNQVMPKLRNRVDRALEIGQSITYSGRRVVSPRQNIDPGDPDQNQQEALEVLGASTAGLLVRSDVWRNLGGLNPEICLFRDGVEFGWRANQAGYQVKTCPEARLVHQQMGRWGDRNSALTDDPDALDRQMAMIVLTAHAKNPAKSTRRLLAGCLTGALGFFVGKDPDRARSYLKAYRDFKTNQDQVERCREWNGEADAELKPGLIPSRKEALKAAGGRLASGAADWLRDLTGYESSSGTSIDDLTSDDFVSEKQNRGRFSPILLSVLTLFVVSLVASWHLFGKGSLQGSALFRAPETLGQLWQIWITPTAGVPGSPAPWLGMATFGSLITALQPEWFATVAVLFGPLLSGLSAIFLFRRLVKPLWLAALLSTIWGCSLVIFGLTGSGAIGATFIGILLPFLGLGIRHWFVDDINVIDTLRGPGIIALCGGLISGAYPIFWFGLVILAILSVFRRRNRLVGALIIVIGSLLLNAGWVAYLIHEPARLLTGPDPTAVAASPPPALLDAFLGRTNVSAAPLWVSLLTIGMVWVIALACLMVKFGNFKARAFLMAAALGPIILGVALNQQVVGLAQVMVRPTMDLFLMVSLAGLLGIIGFGIDKVVSGYFINQFDIDAADDGVSAAPKRGAVVSESETEIDGEENATLDSDTSAEASQVEPLVKASRVSTEEPTLISSRAGWARQLVRWASAGLCLSVVISLCWWLAAGTNGLHRNPDPLPEYVRSVLLSGRNPRVMMVDVESNSATWALADAKTPKWGSGEYDPVLQNKQASASAADLARQVAQGTMASDFATKLSEIGVAHLWVRSANKDLIAAINNVQGMTSAASGENTYVWTISNLTSRYWVIEHPNEAKDENGKVSLSKDSVAGVNDPSANTTQVVDYQIGPGQAGRVLAIADAKDSRVKVKLDGKLLKAKDTDAWYQVYELGESGGKLSITIRSAIGAALLQIVVVVILVVISAPSVRRRQAARRAL